MDLVIARCERAVVFLGAFSAYPEGFEFGIRVLAAPGDLAVDPFLNGVTGRADMLPGARYAGRLTLDVEFADGRRATSMRHDSISGGEHANPVLSARTGSGTSWSWQQTFWLRPLPPPGPLSFLCEWPAVGMPLTRAQIAAQGIINAAARAQTVFAADDASGREAFWTSAAVQIASQDQPDQHS